VSSEPIDSNLDDSSIPEGIEITAVPAVSEPPVVQRPRPPHPNFWWALLWCIGCLFFTQILPGIAIAIIVAIPLVFQQGVRRHTRPMDAERITQLVALPSIVITQVAGLAFSLLVIRLIAGRDWKRKLALRRPNLQHLLYAVLTIPGLVLLGDSLEAQARKVLPSFSDLGLPDASEAVKQLAAQSPLFVLVLLIAVGPGLWEELWCRGFLGRGLLGRYGIIPGVLMSSFFFGFMHVDPPQATMAAILGVFLHFAYLATRSLWISMLMHFSVNGIAVCALSTDWLRKVLEHEPLPGRRAELQLYLLLGAGVLMAGAFLAFYETRCRLVKLVDTAGWKPDFPGVELPPPGSETWSTCSGPRWDALALMAVGAAVMAYPFYLLVT
jgi:membrane protease YdiL (CAAX protease family)